MSVYLPITSDDLNAHIDGSLTPERTAEVEARLATDAALRAEYIELRAMSRLLSDLPDYTPRRSFQLGAEHRRQPVVTSAPTPITSAPGKIVRLLPIVRQLSVAAALIFMVVAGALFFDINGDTDGDNTSIVGVTDSVDDASEGSEDAAVATEQSDEVLTERGDAASAGDEPMEDLTTLQDGTSAGNAASQAGDNADRSAWVWTSVGLGGLAAALGGLWYMLAQTSRPSRGRDS